eukprot:11322019-Heterocapsa_arctica.AAC.1
MGCSECCLQDLGRLHGEGNHWHYRCIAGKYWCSSLGPHPGPEAFIESYKPAPWASHARPLRLLASRVREAR